MKFKFLLILFISLNSFGQEKLYFFKDSEHKFSNETISTAEFKLYPNKILDPYSDAVYWIKIPAYDTNTKYIFSITYDRIQEANAYQNSIKIKELSNQRYISYKISRKYDVYVQVTPKLHAYIPIEFNNEENSILKEKNQLLINGFYYGFAFLVIIYNLSYYFLFKDDAFLYYSLFLISIVFGIFTMDGMLFFYNITGDFNNFLMILNYVLLAFFSSKFANSYLFLDIYYPKLKKSTYILGVIIILIGVLYLIFKNYYYLLVLNILVFSLLFVYWLCGILLFKKNVYTKILVFAYVIFLFSAIDFFVLKFLGISIVNINGTTIKIGAFIEIIILSFAVLYRMKILKDDNDFMREEIISYSLEVKNLSDEISEEKQMNSEKLETVLSIREDEIFKLIVKGKTNKEIGSLLNISVNTVKFHVKNIYEKLNIKSRKEVLLLSKS